MDAGIMRRRATARSASNLEWARNRNAVRHEPRISLGPISHTIIVVVLVLIVGLIYVAQGAKATSYDYDAAGVDSEIASLEAQKDSLAVENARIKAAAASDSNEIASSMVDAKASGFVEE